MEDELDLLLGELKAPKAPRPRAPKPSAPRPPGELEGVTGLAREFGFRVNATTGGRHNRGSAHYAGRAADLRTRDKTPEEVERLMEAARARGFVVRDERVRPPGQRVWTGPHLHLEVGGAVADPLDSLLDEIKAPAAAPKSEVVTSRVVPEEEEGTDLPEPPKLTRPRLSLQTQAGRAARDVKLRAEKEGGADYRVPVGTGSREDAVRVAALSLAKAEDMPVEFVERWIRERGAGLYDPKTAEVKGTSPTGFATIPAEMVGQLKSDYHKSLSLPSQISRRVGELSDYSLGEHALGAGGAIAGGAMRAADIVTRPLQAAAAGAWAAIPEYADAMVGRGAPDLTKIGVAAGKQFLTGETIPEGQNPYEEMTRESETLRNINPNLPNVLAPVVGMATDPTNLVPAGAVTGVLKRTARGAKLLDKVSDASVLNRGMVAPRPLGLVEEGADLSKLRPKPQTTHHSQIQPRAEGGKFRKVTTKDLLEAKNATPDGGEVPGVEAARGTEASGQAEQLRTPAARAVTRGTPDAGGPGDKLGGDAPREAEVGAAAPEVRELLETPKPLSRPPHADGDVRALQAPET